MPRFAASLSMLFTEGPCLDRFEAAAKAGFRAVLQRDDLTLALFNAPLGTARLIEPLIEHDVRDYFLMSLTQACDVLGKVARPHARLQLDLSHQQMTAGGLAVAIREFWPLAGHIQIAGVPGRHEPDVGEINYRYLFDVVDHLGYKGWNGCENRPRAATLRGLGGWARDIGIGI